MENLYQQQRIIMKRTIAIVAGGDSSEHGVSMKSAEGIYSFIDQQKYNLYIVELTHKSWEAILPDGTRAAIDKNDFSFEENGKRIKPDFAYITIHGTPGENGILYLIRLNTKYDLNSGTLSIDPGRTVKWRYYGTRSSTESFWLGMEDSAAIYKGYIFMTDNGGNLMCLDLNTLQLVWVQDTLDDSNSTPVLEIEKGHLYLYVSTSFRLGWRSYDTATVPVWKIDAETGEIVWHTDYECTTDDGVSGGVQSTIACGKNSLADYIYVTVAKTSDNASGVLACLRKSDGSKAWEDSSSYAWSSPVCVYNKDGSGKVLYCNSTGDIRLLDGKTGKQEDVLSVSEGVIEASPAVYDNYAVVGTRDCKIWGIRLQ